MSSDLYSLGTSFHTHSTSSELVSSDVGGGDFPFISDPSSFPFTSSHTEQNSNLLLFDETLPHSSLDPFSPSFFSFTPPTSFSAFEVKNEEESQVRSSTTTTVEFDYNYNQQFLPHSVSYSGAENVSKYMQRSFSSNCFERKPGLQFQPHHDNNNTTIVDSSPQFQRNDISSPENSMRRVCSTGDLQNMKGNHMSPTEGQEANFKVGRYSAEERKEKISKYRAKRTQRNFNKTIKYACRKTLADNRPRIRGRFARNDEPCEIPKAACSTRDEDEVDFWMEELRLHEELDSVKVGAAEQYLKSYGASQFQYCGF